MDSVFFRIINLIKMMYLLSVLQFVLKILG